MLYFGEDRKLFGNRQTFNKFIERLNELNSQGIPIKNNEKFFKVKIISCCLTGDNLGLNQMQGFVESFNAHFYCRFCKLPKCDCKNFIWENEKLLRNKSNYRKDIMTNNYKLTGIKEESIFNSLLDFHVTQNPSIDIMHDLREGVDHYILMLILKSFIPKYLTVEDLNYKLSNLNLSPIHRNNKPPLIDNDFAKNQKFKFTAQECSIFVGQLNMMLAQKIPVADEYWKLYLELREISKYAYATAKSENFGDTLNNHVANLNTLFLKLSGRALYPKFHNLTHYGRISDSIGLLRFTSCERFEAFHRPFKIMAYNSNNRINLLESIVTKYELNLANRLLNFEENFSFSQIKSGKLRIVSNMEELKTKYLFNFSNTFYNTNFIYYCGYKYEKGIIIILTEDDVMDSHKVFYMVNDILKCNEIFYLCLELLDTTFDRHFYAYEVLKNTDKFCLINVEDLKCKKTTVINKIGQKKYINWYI
jgi:hypothetical protein